MTTVFNPSVKNQAYELIRTGAERFGNFWNHRTPTAQALGYGTWENVPEDVRHCVNGIGSNARKKKKYNHCDPSKPSALKKCTPPVQVAYQGFRITDETLDEIWHGILAIPKDTPNEQLKLIREYVTRMAGLNPATCLLGIDSRMAK